MQDANMALTETCETTSVVAVSNDGTKVCLR